MKNILIVDDDVQVTVMLQKFLSREGFAISTVNDSTQAMQVAESTNPDFFILDLFMPEPNGFELCRIIRASQNFANTPILIITASDDSDSKAIAYVAGANDYITKPFNPDDLLFRINALLDKKKKYTTVTSANKSYARLGVAFV